MAAAGCVCPHPPLLVPEIGRGHRDPVRRTIAAMEELAAAVGEADTIVVVSPHSDGSASRFFVKRSEKLWGDYSAFSCPQVRIAMENDLELVGRLLAVAADDHDVTMVPTEDDFLDHGILVPLGFLRGRRLVSLSIVADYDVHRSLGRLVRRCAEEVGRDVLFLASGDLSHRLKRGAPAGYDPRGAEFDAAVTERLGGGRLDELSGLDRGLVRAAGECGLRSFIALGGFLGEEAGVSPRLLSYEGPFGVGYAVASYGLAS
ncbi:MAG TPA: class III extradiol dioxygenase subunit B-like domain-containing protein [Thermoleophilia bacterium]|nr:class III extradiol dioxygenase subunit B-like domain-containing protein [Thermoleophilia bacterium]